MFGWLWKCYWSLYCSRWTELTYGSLSGPSLQPGHSWLSRWCDFHIYTGLLTSTVQPTAGDHEACCKAQKCILKSTFFRTDDPYWHQTRPMLHTYDMGLHAKFCLCTSRHFGWDRKHTRRLNDSVDDPTCWTWPITFMRQVNKPRPSSLYRRWIKSVV